MTTPWIPEHTVADPSEQEEPSPDITNSWEAAFDPPHLGIPFAPTASARVVDHQGDFMEIFLCVQNLRIVDAGFLTSLPGPGMMAASAWCAAAVGKSLADSARDHAPSDPPPHANGLRRAARLAARAGRAALAKAERSVEGKR
ncbi:hypothetical protein [Desulfolutivibrio sulfoxidireducens]|uniref:hypothetical protein n=1 Tax=Desulfolutivibrio sulfoxidireducens TaxID=2773299 RepID=UPI00159D56BD|nr:hypothetical protein [Desulfolutivibrio sulfoxidireducens]QLA20815.1 hypothetical protein GD604_14385 [Desulfolutivibrio sulfoxidireducens]